VFGIGILYRTLEIRGVSFLAESYSLRKVGLSGAPPRGRAIELR
jgi:hypothetical protein